MAPAPADASSSPDRPQGRRWRRSVAIAAGVALIVQAGLFGQHIERRANLIAPPPTRILYDRHGAFIAQIGEASVSGNAAGRRIDYGFWPLENPPDRIVRATLALEDRRFAQHPGVDPIAVLRALWRRFEKGDRSGASTIAMQVARMQEPAPRTLYSKVGEAATALALTLRYGREAILAQYLRLAPYGNGSHGIAHAARFYFDKPAQDLSWAEITLLSSVPQSPTRLNPLRPLGLARAIRRGHRALDELGRQGVISSAELSLAHRQLAALQPQPAPRRPDALHVVLRYENLLKREASAGSAELRPRATIDLDLQRRVTALARRYLAIWRSQGAGQVAVMVVERETGAVVAALGSNDYGGGDAGALDFTKAQRSPGSALKPFIYALALDRGVIRPSDILADLPEGASGINNADGHFLGPMLPRQALANSRNVPAINLIRSIGLETSFRFLRALGLHDVDAPADSFGASMAIGSLPTTLERLVRAYGALANDGVLRDLVWFEGSQTPPSTRAMSMDAARLVTSFLSDPNARLPSFPRYGPLEYPFPVAIKTGTSQGYRDAVTIAWSPQYLIGVWLGRADAGTMTRLSGASSAARLAHAVLLQLHKTRAGDLDDSGFAPPPGRAPVELCLFGGRRSLGAARGGCGQTLTEWLRPEEIPPEEEIVVSPDGPSRLRIPASQRAWARAAGYRVADEGPMGEESRLSIVSPENNSRIWRNPDAPAALSRIALKAVVEPRSAEVVWYVDGEPFATADPDKPVFWPLQKGAHQFQLRLPLQPGRSKTVRITVE
ncbi:transglycosylase domain-containing protein [Methylocella tundrae]|uniref:transglycosylase domain-containing protein n=1 Tax=Methylocella tundrae TaxID=227605 RepID=UPI0030FE6DE4|nr:transglycosylase domain-containing protein [Methylocella tundrae]